MKTKQNSLEQNVGIGAGAERYGFVCFLDEIRGRLDFVFFFARRRHLGGAPCHSQLEVVVWQGSLRHVGG